MPRFYLTNPKAVEPILTTPDRWRDRLLFDHGCPQGQRHQDAQADMKGKKLGFADPDSTSGYLIPRYLPAEGHQDPVKEYFSETGFGGGHENLVLAVKDGKFDAGTTFGSGVGKFDEGYTSGNLRKMVDKGLIDMNDFVELWKSPLIPNGPIVIRTSLDADLKNKFKAFMLDLPKSDPACFAATMGGDFKSYTEVNTQFYQPIIDARKAQIGG
jgi:phosphonate transport system substrate-binding protein